MAEFLTSSGGSVIGAAAAGLLGTILGVGIAGLAGGAGRRNEERDAINISIEAGISRKSLIEIANALILYPGPANPDLMIKFLASGTHLGRSDWFGD